MRKLLMPLVGALIAAAITTGIAAGRSGDDGNSQRGDDDEASTYAIGLWGDLPYSTVQETIGVPNLIADMNSQKPAFTVHDGDLKQGSNSPCDDALYTHAAASLNSLGAPAMFTPGDNDWTDCDRASNGGFNSRERLDHERQVLFRTPFSLGQRRLRQEVQTTPLCLGFNGLAQCVGNRRWTTGGVMYATVNFQARATTSATPLPTRRSTPRATGRTSPGCSRRSRPPAPAGRPP